MIKWPNKRAYGFAEVNLSMKDIHGVSHGISWSDDEVDKWNAAIDACIEAEKRGRKGKR